MKLGCRDDAFDPAVFDDHGLAIMEDLAIEDAGAFKSEALHRVSVTFLRSRGLSGLRPRRREMRSALP